MRESFQNKDGEWVHPAGAAILLGVCTRTLCNWRKPQMINGELRFPPIPFIRMPNGTHRYRVSDIRDFISRAEVAAQVTGPVPLQLRGEK